MKKVLAFLLSVLIALGVMINNGIKANAVIAAPMFLTWILQACEALLIGSGTVTQTQFNNMSTTDVLDTSSGVIKQNPNITLPSDYGIKVSENIGKFINENKEAIASGAFSIAAPVLSALDFHKYVNDNVDNLDKVTVGEGVDMKGYGALLVWNFYSASDKRTYIHYYWGDYGNIRLSTNKASMFYSEHQMTDTSNGKVYTDGAGGYSWDLTLSLQFYGDWRYYEDGTPAYDYITSSETETKPADIGEVEVDGQSYPVSGDGTVAIGDNTYPINDDGSVTIDGKKYYPEFDLSPYDDTAIIDLLNQILQQIQVTDDGNPAKEVIDNAVVEVPIEIANSDLASLEMPKSIATVFPFCIPWDFYNGLQLLAQKPKAPRFEVPFEIPQFGLFRGYKSVIVLDFSDYEDTFAVVRWVTFTLFMFALCFITFKIVKGA